MAGVSLLALLDDIAMVLDDVALMTKVAAKKTAGVLGDDLALNAQQVSGVRADRELPVVWAVAKGSFLNKLIIVPVALALNAVYPPIITALLMLGGLFLCFEGFEKVYHLLFHSASKFADDKKQHLQALADPNIDLVAFEKKKIQGAIRTDFILSAEIIVIALGSAATASFLTQSLVLATLAIVLTIGVYGLVAGIVKLDDLGMYLLQRSKEGHGRAWMAISGKALLAFAPFLMKVLVVVGTAAMFLVGGGILLHGIPLLAEWSHGIEAMLKGGGGISGYIAYAVPTLFSALVGIVAGGIVLLVVSIVQSVRGKLSA